MMEKTIQFENRTVRMIDWILKHISDVLYVSVCWTQQILKWVRVGIHTLCCSTNTAVTNGPDSILWWMSKVVQFNYKYILSAVWMRNIIF